MHGGTLFSIQNDQKLIADLTGPEARGGTPANFG